jgi:plastocyanin
MGPLSRSDSTNARRPTALLSVLLATVAIGLAGCGGGGDSTAATSAAAGTRTVTIADYLYKPAKLTVPAGASLKFVNRDSTPHTATSKQAGAFDTDAIATDKSAGVVLDEPGTYVYYCRFHPFMKATVTVE